MSEKRCDYFPEKKNFWGDGEDPVVKFHRICGNEEWILLILEAFKFRVLLKQHKLLYEMHVKSNYHFLFCIQTFFFINCLSFPS